MYILAGRAVRGSSPTQFSVCLGQTVSGFSAWWCPPTAHLNISPEGKAFALTVNSYITIVLIKNMDSCFTAGLLQGIKREHFSTLCIWSDSTWQASQGIWMLFSSEELAQGASPTGTGRLKPIPHTGIPRNSEPTWCLKHIDLTPHILCMCLMAGRWAITKYCIRNFSSRSVQGWLHWPAADDSLVPCSLCLEPLTHPCLCELV